MAGVGLGIPDGGDGGGRQADGVGVAGGEPQAGAQRVTGRSKPGIKYRVDQKKCPIAIFSLNLFQRSDLTFSHVFRNQNFEPVPSKHFKHTHSE